MGNLNPINAAAAPHLRLGEELLGVRPVDGVLGEERVLGHHVDVALVAHGERHRVEARQAGDRHDAGTQAGETRGEIDRESSMAPESSKGLITEG